MKKVVTYTSPRKTSYATADDLLGTDLKFPLSVNNRGDLETISGIENLQQALIDLIETRAGECFYYEDRGVGLPTYLHKPLNQQVANEIAFKIKDEVMRWEPRVSSITVNTDVDYDNNRIIFTITYQEIHYARKTAPKTFVYPYDIK